ncbi:MAG: molybdate ABC transporter permease subunit, partial [Candidatus Hydrogenedentes bacterium]|nr:molybdate ABC transporter permease subunit [Candidatus Hydrogenedentota bacterium]
MTETSSAISAVLLSLQVSLWCVVVMLIPGITAGYVLARKQFPGKLLFDAAIHAPLVMPPVVTGYLLLLLLGNKGFIGSRLAEWFGIQLAFDWKGAVLAAAVVGFPLMVRSVRLAIELVDTHLEQAAQSLGASPFQTFRTITLPLAFPGILTGVVLAFARSLGEFGATITFVGSIPGETQTLPLAIFAYIQVPGKEQAALALAAVSIVMSL